MKDVAYENGKGHMPDRHNVCGDRNEYLIDGWLLFLGLFGM